MSLKYCSVAGCYNSTILGRKKKLFFEIPKSEPLKRIWAKSGPGHNETIRYFCEDHFLPDDIEGEDLKRYAAPLRNIPEEESNHLVYSNRRKSLKPPQFMLTPLISTVDSSTTPPPHTLVDNESNENDTQIQLVFRDFGEDDVVLPIESDECPPSHLVVDDGEGDCVITNEISSTIIDLSQDHVESSKLIEVIPCYEFEVEGVEEINDDLGDGTNSQESNLATIDLTIEEEGAIIEISDKNEATYIPTIDLTDEQCCDDGEKVAAAETHPTFLQQILNLADKHPESLKSIHRNKQTGELEIQMCKDDSFKSEEEFQQHLIKVIEVVQQRRERDMTVESVELVESDGYPSLNDDATQGKIKVVDVKSLQPRKRSIAASKKERNASDQPTKKRRVPAIVVDDNSSNESDDPDTPTVDEKSSQLFGNIRYCNSNKMLARANSYLGVCTESLKLLENLLRDGSKMQFALLLLLRKLKLNEPFSTLSEVLCWSRRDCRHLYETFLIEVSNNLREVIRWPANCRETNGIADIFEVEIGKPQSFVEQHLSFCNQRQRYFMKFLISITTSGYITHVSIPFYSIQSDTLDSCLASNRQSCSTLAVNPILINCRSNKNLQTTTVPLCKSDRRNIQVVFKRMRRFAVLTQIVDVKNAKYTQHVVRLVASLCNINQK